VNEDETRDAIVGGGVLGGGWATRCDVRCNGKKEIADEGEEGESGFENSGVGRCECSTACAL
jgi:hypothetical protein